MTRAFSASQRAALYLAADGRCMRCGDRLAPGWHADHINPHSKGGATDVVNGQALCPACNLQKGSRTIMTDLRPWQQEALASYLRLDKRDFLAVACPGAGKTTWALSVAKMLLDRRAIRRVIVVVPSDALRTQWSDHTAAQVDLRPYTEGPVDKAGYHGIVTTYQALGGVTSGIIRNAIGGDDLDGTLVILDEIHHAADTTAYGENLAFAFGNARRRLLLTGTPWRTDSRERMPFVEFDQTGMLRVDYSYDYGQAVADSVCRRINFPVIDATVEWVRDLEARSEQLTVNRNLSGVDRSDALRALLDPSATGGWLGDVIARAHSDLMSMRREVPDAAGLIVARDKEHARKVQRRLRDLTGVTASVVVSAEDEGGDNAKSRGLIESFRESSDPWIIAVKMIAEGVDIPRLMVGIYATNVSTAMFFNQVVGRFVRVRSGERATSHMYVPPTPELWAIVQEIQRMLPQRLDQEAPSQRDRDGSDGRERVESDFSPVGSEANGLSFVHTHDGDVQGSLIGTWSTFLDAQGIPTHYATQAAASGSMPPARVATMDRAEPRHRQERKLRKEVDALAGRVAYACYGDHTNKKAVYRDLWRLAGRSVKEQDLVELEASKESLQDALISGERLVD